MVSEIDVIKTIFSSEYGCQIENFNETNEKRARLLCLNMGIQISSTEDNKFPYQDFLCKVSQSNIIKNGINFSNLGIGRTNFIDMVNIFKGGYDKGLNFIQILKLMFIYLRKTFSFIEISSYISLVALFGSFYLYFKGNIDYVAPLISSVSYGVYVIILKLFQSKVYSGKDNLGTLELILKLENYLNFFFLIKEKSKKKVFYNKILKPIIDRIYKIFSSNDFASYSVERQKFAEISDKINKVEEKIEEIELKENDIKQQEEGEDS